jgi:hypothetical protein
VLDEVVGEQFVAEFDPALVEDFQRNSADSRRV